MMRGTFVMTGPGAGFDELIDDLGCLTNLLEANPASSPRVTVWVRPHPEIDLVVCQRK